MKFGEFFKQFVNPGRPLPLETSKTTTRGSGEKPPFTVRIWVGAVGVFVLACVLCLARIGGNPLAKVNDARRAKQYNTEPLTSLAARKEVDRVWLGSLGGGIKEYQPGTHLFGRDYTRSNTEGELLSDYVHDVKFSPDGMAAIVVSEEGKGSGGVQIAAQGFAGAMHFWKDPCVGLGAFAGLEDSTARAVIDSSDGRWLVVGTRGFGIGVYSVQGHAWTAVLTEKDGLPSASINDLAAITQETNGSVSVIWVATDNGLCGGTLDTGGKVTLNSSWTLGRQDGLAGDSVQRLTVKDGFLWYCTRNSGMGRIRITDVGSPVSGKSHELLVSEQAVPGLNDRSFQRIAVNSVGPRHTVWFIGTNDTGSVVGRYREKPQDTLGTAVPSDFPTNGITSMAVDLATGDATLIGAHAGAWYYTEVQRQTGPDSRSDLFPTNLAGSFAGLSSYSVTEVALAKPNALVKVREDVQPSMLQVSKVPAFGTDWAWTTLVGNGRFPGLEAAGDVKCAAKSTNGVIYFGTAGKGIGVWDRSTMEVRREFHSSHPDAAKRLARDGSLALGMTRQGELLQVTDQGGVDVLNLAAGQPLVSLVPPDEAPFMTQQLVTATANVRYWAGAGNGKVAVYDANEFSWTNYPDVTSVSELAVTDGRLWALDKSGHLQAACIGEPDQSWLMVTGGVERIVATADSLIALVREGSGAGKLVAYNGKDATLKFQVAPGALDAELNQNAWKFAAVFEDDLYLAGDAAAFHVYSSANREWRTIPFDGGGGTAGGAPIQTPLRSMIQTRDSILQTDDSVWLVDSSSKLHQYRVGDHHFLYGIATNVVRVTPGADGVLVRTTDASGPRLVYLHANGNAPDVLIGKAFLGQTEADLAEAVEYRGKLVAAQGKQVGFYNWTNHDWTTVSPIVDSVTALHVVDDKLWIQGTLPGIPANAGTLQVWRENEDRFSPVTMNGRPMAFCKVTPAQTGLFAMDPSGRVFFVSALPDGSAEVRLRLAAPRIAGSNPQKFASEQAGLLETSLLLYQNQAFHLYAPSNGLSVWTETPFPDPGTSALRVFTRPGGKEAVAYSRDEAWVISGSDDNTISSTKVLGEARGTAPRADRTITGVAASRDEVVAMYTLRPGGENNVASGKADGKSDTQKVIGNGLLAREAGRSTRSVVPDLDSGGLIRLDSLGKLSFYNALTHEWSGVADAFSADTLWKIGDSLFAYSAAKGSLIMSSNGDKWDVAGSSYFEGEIAHVIPGQDGILVEKKRQGLAPEGLFYVTREGGVQTVSVSHRKTRPSLNLGSVSELAADRDLLCVRGDSGQLATYHWSRQKWMDGTLNGVVQLIRGNVPGDSLYVLRDLAGKKALAGPLVAGKNTGELLAPPIACQKELKRLAATDNGVFALGADSAVYRLVPQSQKMERIWGGVGGGDTRSLSAFNEIVGARLEGGSLNMALSDGTASLLVAKIDSQRLVFKRVAEAAGKVEKLLSSESGQVLAVMRNAAGLYLVDPFTGVGITKPDEKVKAMALVGRNILALKDGQVVEMGGGVQGRTALPLAALPMGAEELGHSLIVPFGDQLTLMRADGRAFRWKDNGVGWDPVNAGAADRAFSGLWMHGDRLFGVVNQGGIINVSEFTESGVNDLKRMDGGGASFGDLPSKASEVTYFPSSKSHTVFLSKKGADDTLQYQTVKLENGRVRLPAVKVETGAQTNEIRVTATSGAVCVFKIGIGGELLESPSTNTVAALPFRDLGTNSAALASVFLKSGLRLKKDTRVCMAGGYAWGVSERGYLYRLASETNLPSVAYIGGSLPVVPLPNGVFGQGSVMLVQGREGSVYRFDMSNGFSLIAEPGSVKALFRMDREMLAVSSWAPLAIRAMKPDTTGFLPSLVLNTARCIGQVTFTAPAGWKWTDKSLWRTPAVVSGEFKFGGKGLKMMSTVQTVQMDWDQVSDIVAGTVDGVSVLVCKTPLGNRAFRREKSGWVRVQADDAVQVSGQLPELAGTYGAFSLKLTSGGRWKGFGLTDQNFELMVGEKQPCPVFWSRTSSVMAHEVVADVAADKDNLYLATEAGVVTLKVNGNGTVQDAILQQVGSGQPPASVVNVTMGASLMCRTGKSALYCLTGGEWRESSMTDADARKEAFQASAGQSLGLSDWRLSASSSSALPLKLERQFGDGNWKGVSLSAAGFDFERVFAVDMEPDALVYYTEAGRLLFARSGWKYGLPSDLDSRCRTPDGAGMGMNQIVKVKQDVFAVPFSLAPGNDKGTVWVLDGDSWRIPSDVQRASLAELATLPFIKNDRWEWQRSVAGVPEVVTWMPETRRVTAEFSVSDGRFGWDICRQVGQSAGVPWLLTGAGLFKVENGRMMMDSQVKLPKGSEAWRFLDVTGDMPGALVDGAGGFQMGWQAGWVKADAVSASVLDSIRKYRLAGPLWRVSRDGFFFRSRPQDPKVFDAVEMTGGMWSFDRVNDIAAKSDICYAATDGGVSGVSADRQALVFLWAATGKVERIQVETNGLLARTGGMILEASENVFRVSQKAWVDDDAARSRMGSRWRVTKEKGKLSFQTKLVSDSDWDDVAFVTNEFAFDQIHDAFSTGRDSLALSTAHGLLSLMENGDFVKVEAAKDRLDRYDFFRPLGVEVDGSRVHAMGKKGGFLRFDGKWDAIPDQQGQEAWSLAATRIAMNERWQVVKTNATVRIGLHLADDPPQFYTDMPFDYGKRVFLSDDLVAVAELPDRNLLIGSMAGLQCVSENGQKMLRLWGNESVDGIPSIRILPPLARSRDGQVHVKTAADSYFTVGQRKGSAVPSSEAEYAQACAIRASYTNGWSMVMSNSMPAAVNICWKDQPVTLVPSGSGSRFAHNVVCAVGMDKERVVLGTLGGMVRLPSAAAADRKAFELVVPEFSGYNPGDSACAVARVLEQDTGAVYAQIRGSPERECWRVDGDQFLKPRKETVDNATWQRLCTIGSDDTLRWSAPSEAETAVTFMPGKSVPEGSAVAVSDGTFCFLDLDCKSDRGTSLTATPDGFFWLTRAGIVRYNFETNSFQKLYAATAQGQRLENVSRLRWSVRDQELNAYVAQAVYGFQALDGWVPPAAAVLPEAPDLVLAGSNLVWRQTANGGVSVAVKDSDQPNGWVFQDGKPLLDAVNGFDFVTEGGQRKLLVATRAGVAECGSERFDYQCLQAARFSPMADQPMSVVEVAAAAMTDGVTRAVGRTTRGDWFERAGGKWAPSSSAAVQDVLTASYRRIERPDLWAWFRYPEGLSSVLKRVNGAPVTFGSSVQTNETPIFSRGRLVFDDVRKVEFTDSANLMLATPVGVSRFKVDSERELCEWGGLDVWADTDSNGKNKMLDLGLFLAGSTGSLNVCNAEFSFETADLDSRRWIRKGAMAEDAKQARTWLMDHIVWKVKAAVKDEPRLSVERNGCEWVTPAMPGPIMDVGSSAYGLWCLLGDELFHVSDWRANRYLFNLKRCTQLSHWMNYARDTCEPLLSKVNYAITPWRWPQVQSAYEWLLSKWSQLQETSTPVVVSPPPPATQPVDLAQSPPATQPMNLTQPPAAATIQEQIPTTKKGVLIVRSPLEGEVRVGNKTSVMIGSGGELSWDDLDVGTISVVVTSGKQTWTEVADIRAGQTCELTAKFSQVEEKKPTDGDLGNGDGRREEEQIRKAKEAKEKAGRVQNPAEAHGLQANGELAKKVLAEAVSASRDAKGRKQWQVCVEKANEALAVEPENADAQGLKDEAERAIKALVETLSASRDAKGRKQWQLCFDKANEVLAAEPENADAQGLKVESERAMNIAALRAAAKDAKDGGLWRVCADKSSDLLALVPGDAEALELKTLSEANLAPMLKVTAVVGGIEVDAVISDGKTTYKSAETFKLKKFETYEFAVHYKDPPSSPVRYKEAKLRLTAVWKGLRSERVVLEELIGPVEGESWISSSTGMEFVWVPALKLWVGKYEVTNGEFRKMDQIHNSGRSEIYRFSLNSERQPVVNVDFDDAARYAVWMTGKDRGGLGGWRYRLPTEDEWLVFAQCGDGRDFPWGNTMSPKFGNYADETLKRLFGNDMVITGYDDKNVVTCPVERSGANPWGLYGVGGNVWECCASDAAGTSFGGWRGASWSTITFSLLRCKTLVSGNVSRDECGFRIILSR